jgi:hypothetical protein
VHYVRYADDFVLIFQYRNEANAVLSQLRDRLGKFNLELAEDKTRIIPFGRYTGTKESFDFLGFSFCNTKTRAGKYTIGVRTSKSRLKSKKQAAKAWLRERLTHPVAETMKRIRLALIGHYNYYGVNGNIKMLINFYN